MSGCKPILETELPLIHAVLPEFSLRDQALIMLGLNTGFRIGELLSLNIADVWDGQQVRSRVKVTRGKMKGGKGAKRKSICSRVVPLNEQAKGYLGDYLNSRIEPLTDIKSTALFPSRFRGKRLTRWGANKVVHAVLACAGLETQGDYGTHTLRKTFCRQIYKGTQHDLNLTRAVMGHRNCATTQRYLHVDEDEVTEAILGIGSTPAQESPQGGATLKADEPIYMSFGL